MEFIKNNEVSDLKIAHQYTKTMKGKQFLLFDNGES